MTTPTTALAGEIEAARRNTDGAISSGDGPIYIRQALDAERALADRIIAEREKKVAKLEMALREAHLALDYAYPTGPAKPHPDARTRHIFRAWTVLSAALEDA